MLLQLMHVKPFMSLKYERKTSYLYLNAQEQELIYTMCQRFRKQFYKLVTNLSCKD
jgi:hypothetical protein